MYLKFENKLELGKAKLCLSSVYPSEICIRFYLLGNESPMVAMSHLWLKNLMSRNCSAIVHYLCNSPLFVYSIFQTYSSWQIGTHNEMNKLMYFKIQFSFDMLLSSVPP